MNPAIADLRERNIFREPERLTQLLADVFAEKGISPATVRHLLDDAKTAYTLAQLVSHFMMRQSYAASSPVLQRSLLASLERRVAVSYYGTGQENVMIDRAITDSFDTLGYRDSIGYGSASFFSLNGFHLARDRFRSALNTPILILGAGAAGTLIARTLVNAGYHNIMVLDDHGQYGGIWNQKNVRGGSRNNPRPIIFETFRVEPSESLGDGEDVTSFLATLAQPPRYTGWRALPVIGKAKVDAVIPGELSHRVLYHTAQGAYTIEAPIVLNTLGLGRPLLPSRPGVMTTDVAPHEAGIRWQQILTPEAARKLQGKTLGFIGLGNSTIEMLIQLQRYIRAGLDLRYRVLTHYPEEALDSPRSERRLNGNAYRLYRDVNTPILTKLAGDLAAVNEAYRHARNADAEREEIIGDVVHWSLYERELSVSTRSGRPRQFPCDQLYTLIGYGHPKEELEAFGMWVLDEYLGTIAADYDGEIQRVPGAIGRARLYPGYFAFGSLLKTPENPNAAVIPGMLYRLADIFPTILLRSVEYAWGNTASLPMLRPQKREDVSLHPSEALPLHAGQARLNS